MKSETASMGVDLEEKGRVCVNLDKNEAQSAQLIREARQITIDARIMCDACPYSLMAVRKLSCNSFIVNGLSSSYT